MDRRVLDVARFEFRRFLDIRGELIGVSVLVLIALIRFGGEALMVMSTPSNLAIAVETNVDGLLPMGQSGRFHFAAAEPEARVESLRRIRDGDLAGLLIEETPNHYRLYTSDRVHWQDALADSFAPWHRLLRARRAGISEADLQAITADPQLVSTHLQGGGDRAGVATYAASISIMVLSILGIISALSLVLQGIAGEKFGRISEIVLSAISPSIWIDGKLIAATLHGIKTIFSYAIYGVLASILLGFLDPAQLFDALRAWPELLSALLIGVIGLGFWSVAFALVAALLPSATSPIRNTLILVPMTCLILCLGGAKEPDNAFMVALSFFPPTMPFALPLRIIADTVAAWEVVVSVGLALASIWRMRGVVVSVFADAVLGAGTKGSAAAARV